MLTETEERVPHAESSLSQLPSLLKRFCDQFLKLFETQLALFKTELQGAVRVYARHLILAIAAGFVASLGFSFLSVGLAFWINDYVHNLAVSFALVGGTYLVIGAISVMTAVRRITYQPPVLTQTMAELEKDQQWIKTETRQAR